MYRNSSILQFTEDFRLQKDGRPFHTTMTFGMDAGYAMEGAVGSKYKVDATYRKRRKGRRNVLEDVRENPNRGIKDMRLYTPRHPILQFSYF